MAFDITKPVRFVMSLEGAEKVQAGVRGVTDGMWDTERAVNFAKTAFIGLVGIAGISAFAGMVKGSIEAGGGLHDLSIQTELSVAALGQFRSIGALSETSAESIATATNKLSKGLAMTSEEGKGATVALKALGLDFDTFRKLAPEQQMLAVAQAMGGFQDGADKSAAAMLLFGKEGAKLLPFLGDLAEQHDKVVAALTEEEVALKKNQAAMADAFGDNLTKIRKESEGWKKDISMGLLPALYEASEAVLGMNKGTGGLKDEISKLAKDGTLADWARGAVTAFTYLMDVGQGLFSLIPMLGKLIAGVAAGTSTLFAGIFDAMGKLKSGDITGAWESLKGGFTGVAEVANQTGTDISNIWGQKLLGAALRDRMADLKGTGVAAGETKKAMASLADVAAGFATNEKEQAKAAKEAEAAQKKLTDEYIRAVVAGNELLAGFGKKNAARQLELDMGRKLTTAEKEMLDLDEKVRLGKIKLTDAAYQSARAEIEHGQALEDQARAAEESRKANDAYWSSLVRSGEAINDEIDKQRESNAQLGMSKSALTELGIAKLQDRAATLERAAAEGQANGVSALVTQEMLSQAEALRTLATARREGFDKAAAIETQNAWLATGQSIADGLAGALMNGTRSAVDYIKNLLKQSAFKYLVQPVMGSMMGGLGSLFSGSANAGTGGGGGDLGGLSGLGSIFGSGGALSTLGSFGTTGFMSTLTGTGLGTTLGAAGSLMQGGSVMGGLGMGIGAVAPYALAAAALYTMLNKKSTPHVGGYAMGNADGSVSDITGLQGGNQEASSQKAMGELAKLSAGLLNSTAAGFGKQGGYSVRSVFESDNNDPSWGLFHMLQGGAKTGSSFDALGTLNKDAATGLAEFTGQAGVALRAELEAMDLPKWASDTLDALGASPGVEDLATAVQQINSARDALAGMVDAVTPLGGVFSRIGGLSSDAQMQLANFAGGIDAFMAKTNSYVASYFSEQEQQALKAQDIMAQMAAVGIDASGAHDKSQLRGMMDSIDPNTEAGRQQISALLNVATQYADVSKYLEDNKIVLGTLAAQAPTSDALAKLRTPSESTAVNTAKAAEETAALRDEMGAKLDAVISQNNSTAATLAATLRIYQQWNQDGMPTTRVEA